MHAITCKLLMVRLMLVLLLLLLLLHRHLHVAAELLLLRRHAIRHVHAETSKLGLLLLLLLLIPLPYAWWWRWLLAHSAHLAGVHRALDVLGVAVHSVVECGVVLVPIQALLTVAAVVALVSAMAPAVIIPLVDSHVWLAWIIVCSAAAIPLVAVVAPPIVVVAVVAVAVVVVVPTIAVVATVVVVAIAVPLLVIIPAAIIVVVVVGAAVVAVPLLLLLLALHVAHHVGHLLLEASIRLLHLLVGVRQSRDDGLGAVVRCTELVHRIVEGVVLLYVRRRLRRVCSESKIAGSVGGDAF